MLVPTGPTQAGYVIDWTPVRHSATFLGKPVEFRINPPADLARVALARALASAVERLRTVEGAFAPRPTGEPLHAAITTAVMTGCRDVREATHGYFDPWAMPGGFNPDGLLRGWAMERAAAVLTEAGLPDFAISAGDELLVRGAAPNGQRWQVGIRPPGHGALTVSLPITDAAVSMSTGRVIDPHTQRLATHWDAVAVTGPDLGIADAYATGLRAAGPARLSWFPTPDGYHAVLFAAPRPDQPVRLQPAA
ncbi:MAG: FAD:protein FMN transferase [Micromonosporaceae bacterium]